MRSLLSNGRVSHQFPVFPLFQDVTILAEHETSSRASDNGNVISQISPIGKWLKGWEGLCLPYLFWPMSEFWLEIGEVGPFISWFQPLRYWGKKCLCNAFRAKGWNHDRVQIDTDTSWLTLCIMMYPMYPLWCVLSMGIWKVAPPMKRATPPKYFLQILNMVCKDPFISGCNSALSACEKGGAWRESFMVHTWADGDTWQKDECDTTGSDFIATSSHSQQISTLQKLRLWLQWLRTSSLSQPCWVLLGRAGTRPPVVCQALKPPSLTNFDKTCGLRRQWGCSQDSSIRS